MLINDLLQTRIFRLLSETSQEVTNDELQNAYGELLEHIRCVSGHPKSQSHSILSQESIVVRTKGNRTVHLLYEQRARDGRTGQGFSRVLAEIIDS